LVFKKVNDMKCNKFLFVLFGLLTVFMAGEVKPSNGQTQDILPPGATGNPYEPPASRPSSYPHRSPFIQRLEPRIPQGTGVAGVGCAGTAIGVVVVAAETAYLGYEIGAIIYYEYQYDGFEENYLDSSTALYVDQGMDAETARAKSESEVTNLMDHSLGYWDYFYQDYLDWF
jgi:hypothetical protein